MESAATAAQQESADLGTTVKIASDGDIITARREGRMLVMRLGFSLLEATLVATAISELARNIIMHADHGEIVVRPVHRDGKSGVLVIARDDGPGIANLEQATAGGSCHRLGLRGMQRLMDEWEIQSAIGRGTTIAARKWKA